MSILTYCKNHPNIQANYSCYECRRPLCDECVRTRDNDNALVCDECLKKAAASGSSELYDVSDAPVSSVAPAAIHSIGIQCKVHPDVGAVAQCKNCGAGVCTTCDFAFGDLHLCPECATASQGKLSSGRKTQFITSLVLGAVSIIASVASFILLIAVQAAGKAADLQVFGCFILFCMLLSVVGFVVGITAMNRRAYNPGYLWIGPILNGLNALGWLALIIIGNMRGH